MAWKPENSSKLFMSLVDVQCLPFDFDYFFLKCQLCIACDFVTLCLKHTHTHYIAKQNVCLHFTFACMQYMSVIFNSNSITDTHKIQTIWRVSNLIHTLACWVWTMKFFNHHDPLVSVRKLHFDYVIPFHCWFFYYYYSINYANGDEHEKLPTAKFHSCVC